MTSASYRGNPEAVRALVQRDRVHRDLYINPDLFELEQEHFFANTSVTTTCTRSEGSRSFNDRDSSPAARNDTSFSTRS